MSHSLSKPRPSICLVLGPVITAQRGQGFLYLLEEAKWGYKHASSWGEGKGEWSTLPVISIQWREKEHGGGA